ncbi:MAG: radical SAM protein, partial [Nitrospirae bacterium]
MGGFSLKYVQFYPTLRCNKNCAFCFNQGLELCDDTTLEDYQTIVKKLKNNGVSSVDIMGGEPLLNSDISSIVDATLKSGLEVNISTNGTVKKGIRDLLQRFSGSIRLGVSVNSLKDLRESAEIIRTFRTITKTVYNEKVVEETTRAVLSLKPKRHYILYPDILNGGSSSYKIPFYSFYHIWQKRYAPLGIGAVFCGGFLPEPENSHLRCPAGTVKIGILPDGSVYPCNLFFGIKDFYLGNIYTHSLEEILSRPVLEY